jgi:hypothetical protein
MRPFFVFVTVGCLTSCAASGPCEAGSARCLGSVVQHCDGKAWLSVTDCAAGAATCSFGSCTTASGDGGSAAAGGSGGGTAAQGCGNGVREVGEACDGAELQSMTCQRLGFASGALRCASSCDFDVSACVTNTVPTVSTLLDRESFATPAFGGLTLAMDESRLYWLTAAGEVHAAFRVGSAPVTLATGQTGANALALDDTHVYWTVSGSGAMSGAVRRVSKQGGAVSEVASSQPEPLGVAVDGQAVYWVNSGAPGGVMKVAVGGGAPASLTTGAAHRLALDATQVWFLTSPGRLSAVSKSGGAPTIVSPGPATGTLPVGLLADALGQAWVVAGSANDQQLKARSEAAPERLVLTGSITGVAANTRHLFVTMGDKVLAVPRAGGAPIEVATGQIAPRHVVVDERTVYWSTAGAELRFTSAP